MRVDGEERVCFDARPHVVVLARPFGKAAVLATAAAVLAVVGWPATVAAAVLLAGGATVATRAAWRWERTRIVVTTRTLGVAHGTLRRRATSVELAGVGAVALEQTLVGRLLGYGTVVAGGLEIPHVAEPRRVAAVVGRLAGRAAAPDRG